MPLVNDMLHLLLALLSNRTLVTLEMGTNGLTDATAEKLGLALKANNKLEGLSLWQNDITAEVSFTEKAYTVFTHKCMHAHTHTHTQSSPFSVPSHALPPPPPPPLGWTVSCRRSAGK